MRLRRAPGCPGAGRPARRGGAASPLETLPSLERRCIVLREQQGLEVGEIARVTGLRRDEVTAALFAAREQLRTVLEV